MLVKIKKHTRKIIIGSAVTIGIGGGSLVFTYTADGCQMEYKQTENIIGVM